MLLTDLLLLRYYGHADLVWPPLAELVGARHGKAEVFYLVQTCIALKLFFDNIFETKVLDVLLVFYGVVKIVVTQNYAIRLVFQDDSKGIIALCLAHSPKLSVGQRFEVGGSDIQWIELVNQLLASRLVFFPLRWLLLHVNVVLCYQQAPRHL